MICEKDKGDVCLEIIQHVLSETPCFHVSVYHPLSGLPPARWRPLPHNDTEKVETAAKVSVSLEVEFHGRLRITTATRLQKQSMGFSPVTLVKQFVLREKAGAQKLKNDQSKHCSSSTILLCWFQGIKTQRQSSVTKDAHWGPGICWAGFALVRRSRDKIHSPFSKTTISNVL